MSLGLAIGASESVTFRRSTRRSRSRGQTGCRAYAVGEVIDPSGGTDFRQITKLAKGFSGISPRGPFGCISHHMFHIAGRTQADIESHMQPECVGGTVDTHRLSTMNGWGTGFLQGRVRSPGSRSARLPMKRTPVWRFAHLTRRSGMPGGRPRVAGAPKSSAHSLRIIGAQPPARVAADAGRIPFAHDHSLRR